jgi:WD40 repeat protein
MGSSALLIRWKAFLCLVLALVGTSPADADTFRVQTDRGTYLVEVNAPDVTVKSDGDDLVVARFKGDEVRLKLEVDRAERNSKEPVLTLRRDGKVIVSARRVSASAPSSSNPGPGRTILGGKPSSSAWSLAISPDGKTLLSGHQGFLRVWDLPRLTERFNVPTGKTVRRVALTPDGSTIASAEYAQVNGKTMGNVVIRDGKTGETRRAMAPVQAIHGVAISPDGKVVVSSSWSEWDVRVWDVEKGEQVGTLKGHSGVVGTILFSPDGKTLASAGDNSVRIWDVDTGATRQILRGHQKQVESVAISGDGRVLASGGFDETARAWDAATGKLLATFEHDDPVLSVAISPDGKTIASAAARWGDGFYGQAPADVQVWDVATSKSIATLPKQPSQIFAMVFTPDGKSLITASLSGAVTVWDLAMFQDEKGSPKPAPPEPR